MKKVLLVTDGIFHPPFFGRVLLHMVLARSKELTFEHVPSLEYLPSDLESYSALVLHYHHKTLSDTALGQLDNFVSNGGGILAVHAATASFKGTMSYFEILGGQFIGHGKVKDFEVRQVRDDLFGEIDSFVVKDELYIHELQPGIEVHFAATLAGKDVPVIWTYYYGKGKICYAVPGHTTATMRNVTYQKVLRRGLDWVCR